MMSLIGALLPPLIDLINRKVGNSDARFWISVLVCAVVGVGIAAVTSNGFSTYKTAMDIADGIGSNILSVIGIAQVMYQGVYEGSSLQKTIRS